MRAGIEQSIDNVVGLIKENEELRRINKELKNELEQLKK